jgi:hypothetical protein
MPHADRKTDVSPRPAAVQQAAQAALCAVCGTQGRPGASALSRTARMRRPAYPKPAVSSTADVAPASALALDHVVDERRLRLAGVSP